MNEYKNFSDEKTNFLLEVDEDNSQTHNFLNLYQSLINFWNENDLDNEKIILEQMLECFVSSASTHEYSAPISGDIIVSLNIIHFIIEKISIIKTFENIKQYSNILNLFLQLLILLSDISTASKNQLINEQPISLFWELVSIPFKEVYIKSTKLIYFIIDNGKSEKEINFLLPKILKEISDNKRRKTKYVMNLLPIISRCCENASQSVLDDYIDDIIKVIHELFETRNYYYYLPTSLIIIRKLQYRKYDIFKKDYELLHKILNIIENIYLQDFYKSVIKIMTMLIYNISNDESRAVIIGEIQEHIDRILLMFEQYKEDKELLTDIIEFLSNFIVEESSIIQKILDFEYIPIIAKYYFDSAFRMRDSIMRLVWNILYGCTSDQLIQVLSYDEIFEVIITTLDYDESDFLFFVLSTIKVMMNRLGYTHMGANQYLDNIISKMQESIQSVDPEIKEHFHDEIPQFF